MRVARVAFVSLLAVGACGVVYVGLTAGLAAYMRYKLGPASADAQASADESQAAPTTGPTSRPAARAVAAVPKVEDAASLLRRRWTAPKAGLTMPRPFAAAPDAGRITLVPVAMQTWFPKAPFARPGVVASDWRTVPPRTRVAPLEPVMELVMADRPKVQLPALPPAKASSADPGDVRLATIAVNRDGSRPDVTADPTEAAGERLLLTRPPPLRNGPAPFEKASIPEPTPNSAGAIRTAVPDDDAPVTPPERPTAIKLPVK